MSARGPTTERLIIRLAVLRIKRDWTCVRRRIRLNDLGSEEIIAEVSRWPALRALIVPFTFLHLRLPQHLNSVQKGVTVLILALKMALSLLQL